MSFVTDYCVTCAGNALVSVTTVTHNLPMRIGTCNTGPCCNRPRRLELDQGQKKFEQGDVYGYKSSYRARGSWARSTAQHIMQYGSVRYYLTVEG